MVKNAGTFTGSLVNKDMLQPNGIAISGNRMVVSYCNQTRWEWWDFDIYQNGTVSEPRVLADLTGKLTGKGYPDGLEIDENGNVWAAAPGGLIIIE